jgi:hypothetical protein
MKPGILAELGGALVCGVVCQAQDKSAGQAAQDKKGQDAMSVPVFNPDKLAKPTAGYSQAEVSDGRIVFIAGQ